jgi:plastocyanin
MVGMTSTTPSERRDAFSVVSIAIAATSLFLAVVGVAFGIRAIDEADDNAAVAAAGGATVHLADFSIEPAAISVAAGGAIEVVNDGPSIHNLTVVDTDAKTADLNTGDSESLDVGDLDAGEYTVICSIAGHEAAGMKATLTIGEGAATGTASSATHGPVDFEAMDQMMRDRTLQFPAETAGVGAQELAPTVLADGTKQFELTASVFDWEVEPGKVVQAWGYNEQVPGPTLRVGVGDKVRIILHNELPESTIMHPHGFIVPNAMDGVPDITQDPIKPGDSFTYEWTVREAMVGMYHSHHDAQLQVPNGLLGAFYAGTMPLPEGVPTPAIDMPMVLNDAGVIGLSLNGKSFPATAPIVAKQGDWIKLDYMNEGFQIHPMHLHGMPQLVVAQDGYPLANPVMQDTVLVAPGQRVSVLVHATEVGAWAWHCHILTHAETSQGMFGMVTALIVQ